MVLTQEQGRALDTLRQRLSYLASSLQRAREELERSETVPKWHDLQSSAHLIALNLDQANSVLAANRHFFTQAHAYPLPNFPGGREEGQQILETLLRKRLDPKAEAWIVQYDRAEPEPVNGLSREELRQLWSWAGPASNKIVREMMDEGHFEDDFTLEEQERGIESVVTGLKRDLTGKDEDEQEDGEDDDADMDDRMLGDRSTPAAAADEPGVDPGEPPLSLETINRFTSTGTLPPDEPPGYANLFKR